MPRKKEAVTPMGRGTSSSVDAFLAMKRTKTYEPAKKPAKVPKTAHERKAAQSRRPAHKTEQKSAREVPKMAETGLKEELTHEPLPNASAASSLVLEPVSTVTTESASPRETHDEAQHQSSVDSHPVPAPESTAKDAPVDGGDESRTGIKTGAADRTKEQKAEAAMLSGRVTRSRAKQSANRTAKKPKVEQSATLGARDAQPDSGVGSQTQRGCTKGLTPKSDTVHDREGAPQGVRAAGEEAGEDKHRDASGLGQARAKEEPRAHEQASKEPTSQEPAGDGRAHQHAGFPSDMFREQPGSAEGGKEETVTEDQLAAAREARAREALSQYPAIQINRAPVLVLWVAVVAEREGFSFEEGLSFGQAVAAMFAQSKGRRLGIYEEKEKEDAEEKEARRKAEGTTQIEVLRLPLCQSSGTFALILSDVSLVADP